METATILVVDDERRIRELVRLYLEREGYSVLLSGSGKHALDTAERARPDLIILDLGLPDIPGEDVARCLRLRSDVPIIMLTAKAAEEDRVEGFRVGADDYVTKPFSPRELVVRVRAVLRRSRGDEGDGSESFDAGALKVERAPHRVALSGVPVELTPTEFKLLVALTSPPGRALSRHELATRVLGDGRQGRWRVIDTHMKNLRHKLGDDPRRPRFVLTVTGVGYRFVGEPDP